MDSSKVHDWIQIVGLLVIAASLVFVGLQVRQTQAIGEGELASNFSEQTLLAPHRGPMRERIAELFEVSPDRVNVKGKSGEGLAPIGTGEAVRATAVALLG